MITFQEIGKYGRLGNQLFQLALLKVISYTTGHEIFLPCDIYNRHHHGQTCLLNFFKLKNIHFSDYTINHTYYEKSDWYYDEDVFNIKDNTNFFGFFQNAQYYNNFREKLIEEFQLTDNIQDNINDILRRYNNKKVSLHVRRGDMSDGTNINMSVWSNDTSKNSYITNYYKKAISMIPRDSTIFLFTGGSRYGDNKSDYEWCKNYFNDERIIFMDKLNAIETFCLIKNCDINITSFISSFSWWASFLNKNNNIIAPLNYFPLSPIKLHNLCPPYWNFI